MSDTPGEATAGQLNTVNVATRGTVLWAVGGAGDEDVGCVAEIRNHDTASSGFAAALPRDTSVCSGLTLAPGSEMKFSHVAVAREHHSVAEKSIVGANGNSPGASPNAVCSLL